MNLIDQVVSLELSKRLKDIGIKQESLFYWYSFDGLPWEVRYENETCIHKKSLLISAFTVAELGEFLPEKISPQTATGNDKYITYYKGQNNYHHCGLQNSKWSISPLFADEKNEANPRALMLIFLLQEKLMELPK